MELPISDEDFGADEESRESCDLSKQKLCEEGNERIPHHLQQVDLPPEMSNHINNSRQVENDNGEQRRKRLK